MPWDDRVFTTPGNQGEQNRMDLLRVLECEVGHLLGSKHDNGVMQGTLAAGERRTLHGVNGDAFWSLSGLPDLNKKRDPFSREL